ncbi:MAG: hypothetical protein JO131_05650, partial [Gammaproteobacteria bacterium]|nr:hypothetical protein [Gammaproteobacteria bacterium]
KLLENSIEVKTLATGSTPVMIAAKNDCVFNVRTLLYFGANSELKPENKEIQKYIDNEMESGGITQDLKKIINELKDILPSATIPSEYSGAITYQAEKLKMYLETIEMGLDKTHDMQFSYKALYSLWENLIKMSNELNSYAEVYKPKLAFFSKNPIHPFQQGLQKSIKICEQQFGFIVGLVSPLEINMPKKTYSNLK